MNVLYLADPNSIHDQKWFTWFRSFENVNIFILSRKVHYKRLEIFSDQDINSVGYIEDFSIVRFYRTLYTAFRIKRIINVYKIDCIHILYAEPNALWCFFRKYFGVPMVITSRGTDVLKTIPEFFKKRSAINCLVAPIYKMAFQLADWITGTSRHQLDSIMKFSERNKRMTLVRTGIDLHRLLDDTSTFYPLSENKPHILFPRYIKPLYNHELCLKAIELLPIEIKLKYNMVFVGKDGGDFQYQKKLESIMDSIHDAHFIFLPKLGQEQIFELYKRATLVVMTPLSDGSPVSAMEAMACGASVILGPLNYDKDIFEDNVIQLSFWNEHELAQLITRSKTHERRTVTKEWLALVDRNSEMNKVWDIYNLLVSKN